MCEDLLPQGLWLKPSYFSFVLVVSFVVLGQESIAHEPYVENGGLGCRRCDVRQPLRSFAATSSEEFAEIDVATGWLSRLSHV